MDFKAAVGNFSASLAPYIKLLQNGNEANIIHCKNNALVASPTALSGFAPFPQQLLWNTI